MCPKDAHKITSICCLFMCHSYPFLFQVDFDEKWAVRDTVLWYGMACMAMVPLLRHCAKDKIEEPKCLTRGIKEVEELKEILNDVML